MGSLATSGEELGGIGVFLGEFLAGDELWRVSSGDEGVERRGCYSSGHDSRWLHSWWLRIAESLQEPRQDFEGCVNQ